MKAFKVVVATRSTVGGHGAVRHAFAEVHPHVVATALLACYPKSGRHLCAMRMLPILPETQKNRTDPQSLALSLLLASPVTSASSCTTSIPVRVTYHAHTLSVQAPGYMWRVSTQAGFTLSSRLPRWRTSGVDEKWHGCQHGKHFFLLGSSSQV